MPNTSPLAIGDSFPALHLIEPSGTTSTWNPGPATELVYFMRASTCPVCHQHVRQLAGLSTPSGPARERITVVVPGGAAEAAAVAKRHPGLAGRIFGSESAHEAVGLFVKIGLQQSGTFAVSQDGLVTWVKTATVPVGAFHHADAVTALG